MPLLSFNSRYGDGDASELSKYAKHRIIPIRNYRISLLRNKYNLHSLFPHGVHCQLSSMQLCQLPKWIFNWIFIENCSTVYSPSFESSDAPPPATPTPPRPLPPTISFSFRLFGSTISLIRLVVSWALLWLWFWCCLRRGLTVVWMCGVGVVDVAGRVISFSSVQNT